MATPAPFSPYAPPRAGRGAWFWRRWFDYRRANHHFERLLPARLARFTIPWTQFAVFVVPLLGFFLASPPLVRRWAPVVFCAAALLALACIGQFASGVAVGFMAALHAFSIAEYLRAIKPSTSGFYRNLRLSGLVLTFTLLGNALAPRVTSWLVVQVGTETGVVLVNPVDRQPPFPADTPVAVHLPRHYHNGLRLDEGLYIGRVIASPGDLVRFGPGSISINGVPRDPLRFMPDKGELRIPPGRTLVWPVDLGNRGRRGEGRMLSADALLVPDSALVGRPYKRWFWRTQTP